MAQQFLLLSHYQEVLVVSENPKSFYFFLQDFF